jgi:uncharacterized protein (DUF58 family)
LPDLYRPEHPNKISFSVYVAAALIFLLRKQRDAAGISIFSDTVELHTQAKSSSIHHKYLYNELERILQPIPVERQKKTSAAAAIHQLAEQIHKRSLVIILSDMMDNSANMEELFSSLQHLRKNKHDVVIFHVVDKKKELDFNFENRPYRFIDLESGQDLKVYPARVKEQYIEAIRKYKSELELRCGQYHIDFVEADINEGFSQVLLPYLVKRGKMF